MLSQVLPDYLPQQLMISASLVRLPLQLKEMVELEGSHLVEEIFLLFEDLRATVVHASQIGTLQEGLFDDLVEKREVKGRLRGEGGVVFINLG